MFIYLCSSVYGDGFNLFVLMTIDKQIKTERIIYFTERHLDEKYIQNSENLLRIFFYICLNFTLNVK